MYEICYIIAQLCVFNILLLRKIFKTGMRQALIYVCKRFIYKKILTLNLFNLVLTIEKKIQPKKYFFKQNLKRNGNFIH